VNHPPKKPTDLHAIKTYSSPGQIAKKSWQNAIRQKSAWPRVLWDLVAGKRTPKLADRKKPSGRSISDPFLRHFGGRSSGWNHGTAQQWFLLITMGSLLVVMDGVIGRSNAG
jgi:hypothetical protein